MPPLYFIGQKYNTPVEGTLSSDVLTFRRRASQILPTRSHMRRCRRVLFGNRRKCEAEAGFSPASAGAGTLLTGCAKRMLSFAREALYQRRRPPVSDVR